MKTYKLYNFDHAEQQHLWQTVCQLLSHHEPQLGDCTLIANLKLDGLTIDALLASPCGIWIFSLMGLHGDVVMSENAPWRSGSRIVPTQGMFRTPFHQLRTLCNTAAKDLSKIMQQDVSQHLKCCVILNDDTTIENQLSLQTQQWLHCVKISELTNHICAQQSSDIPQFSPCQLRLNNHVASTAMSVEVWNLPQQQLLENGNTCYAQLEDLCRMNTTAKERYPSLRELFYRVVEIGISQSRLTFRGLFAKVDYIIKEYNISREVAQQVQATRKSVESTGDKTDAELATSFYHDVKAVSLLLSSLPGQPPIPASLKSFLPEETIISHWASVDLHLVRCLVDEWDDQFIYATEEAESSSIKICYSAQNHYLTREGIGDWSHLTDLLSQGCVLNLLRVRMEDGVCMPELIIYEPDYLINITTVASCFETYAESPLVHLVNLLKPQPNTRHIHLGNLAGQYLDDTVHHRRVSLKESYDNFLRSNALSIASCPDLGSPSLEEAFKKSAKEQLANIHNLIGQVLPQTIKGYCPDKVVLEPSFFSKSLGLQGRMDFYWEDSSGKSLIIEQKSGKGAYNPRATDPQVPIAQEKHWVQLILYRAVLTYEYRRFDRQQQVMLLYSKYAKGLQATAQSPDLLLRAIKLRNQLAWSEMSYAENGFDILSRLTPEILNRKGAKGRLWDGWTKPELDEILTPIHQASPLERAYFLRMMRFVQREHQLSKIGNRSHDESGFAGHWLDGRETKLAAGNLYDQLTIDQCIIEDNAVVGIKLNFQEVKTHDTSNFRRGDIVILYPYIEGQQPEPCQQMVTRAQLCDITPEGVDIALTFPQTNPQVFVRPEGYRWAIEHDMFESSTARLYGALHSMLSAPKEQRDLLLCQRKPKVDSSVTIKGDYGGFNQLVLSAKQSRELFLIIGPPGTGKTSFGMLNLLKEGLLEPDTNILLLSYTNRAVDEICSKLVEEGIDFVRIGSELSCEKRYHANLLSHKVEAMCSEQEVRSLVARTRVFCATTTTMNSHADLFRLKQFNLAIVDEASQILEPHLVGLFSAKYGEDPAIKRWVLIGDHKQLPAVVCQDATDSMVTEPELQAIHLTNCRLSLFERMLNFFKQGKDYDPQYVFMLSKQGRMHGDIADYASRAFYNNKLGVVPLPHQVLPCQPAADNGIAALLTSRRMAFVASERPELPSSGKSNPIEAEMIAATVVQIYRLNQKDFDPAQAVGVIVPYRNQIATIRGAIDRYGIEVLHEITIDTVERYQGSQRDYIIYGFTVTEAYQLTFLSGSSFVEDGRIIDRKLNVAMTRARLHLLLIGEPNILKQNKVFADLIKYMQAHHSYFEIGKDDYCQNNFAISRLS